MKTPRMLFALSLFSLFSLFSVISLAASQPKPQPAPEVPKGEVTKYSFSQSKIFPGTVRDYSIYVPRQYDPVKPACLWVEQDGVQFNIPAVFDRSASWRCPTSRRRCS